MNKSTQILCLLVCIVIGVMTTSCLDDDKKENFSQEAKITKFYLNSKKNKELSNYRFIINEETKEIYNVDSIAYDISLDSVSPVLSPKFKKVVFNDEITITQNDSAFYANFNNPVRVTVYAADGKTNETYTVTAWRHQVDPDTFIWEGVCSQVHSLNSISECAFQLNEELVYLVKTLDEIVKYSSFDGVQWTENLVTGLPSDADLHDVVSDGEKLYYARANTLWTCEGANTFTQVSAAGVGVERALFVLEGSLWGVAQVNGSRRFAVYDGSEWIAKTAVPAGFPVRGAAINVSASPSRKTRAFVVGGIDANDNYLSSVWSTENGTYWSNLTAGKNDFSPRAYAAVAQYSSALMLYGGVNAEGNIPDDSQLVSPDYGINWFKPEEKQKISDMYVPRYDASAISATNGMLYLIGGRVNAQTPVSDVWRAVHYASMPGFKK